MSCPDNEVFLCRPRDLELIVEQNELTDAAERRPNHLLVLFVDKPIRKTVVASLQSYEGPERMVAARRELYIDYVDGVARSTLSPAFLERRLGQAGTARNWNTLQKLIAASAA